MIGILEIGVGLALGLAYKTGTATSGCILMRGLIHIVVSFSGRLISRECVVTGTRRSAFFFKA